MRITAIAGGIGASKLLLGLSNVMPPEDLTIIANTGDDIELFGLRICPDVDTITYTLAGVINEETGWGLNGDTFECLRWLDRYNEPAWFNLGDRDLATHIFRTNQLRCGRSLTEVTDIVRRSLGIRSTILPMTDSYTPTRVATEEGDMHLQEYFVRKKCQPRVLGISSDNIESAAPTPSVLTALRDANAVIICPSNPFISIGPVLAVPGVRDAIRATKATVVAITPIIAGKAVKGPTADMLRDLGHEVSAVAVAKMYGDLLECFILDEMDVRSAEEIRAIGVQPIVANTRMNTLDDKNALARRVIGVLATSTDAEVAGSGALST